MQRVEHDIFNSGSRGKCTLTVQLCYTDLFSRQAKAVLSGGTFQIVGPIDFRFHDFIYILDTWTHAILWVGMHVFGVHVYSVI